MQDPMFGKIMIQAWTDDFPVLMRDHRIPTHRQGDFGLHCLIDMQEVCGVEIPKNVAYLAAIEWCRRYPRTSRDAKPFKDWADMTRSNAEKLIQSYADSLMAGDI